MAVALEHKLLIRKLDLTGHLRPERMGDGNEDEAIPCGSATFIHVMVSLVVWLSERLVSCCRNGNCILHNA